MYNFLYTKTVNISKNFIQLLLKKAHIVKVHKIYKGNKHTIYLEDYCFIHKSTLGGLDFYPTILTLLHVT